MMEAAYLVNVEGYNGDNRLFAFCDADNKDLAMDYANKHSELIKRLNLKCKNISVMCCLNREIVYSINNINM